ncbi:hypothetical protein C7T35_01240 [Variovorax sp. WS11]|uniref:hypothetical protein n=1 Tax=Variovorax sp. WS11 TaxID=1105204 RepID=UPI000D0D83F7|nr:hypothetical protein [Variovorax sp. WS11]NDZ11524.1 hypothetical protein [Variovorax sp. WS11]PSL86621.1 hypothetical protein C7T35_01240 [Variovorax sp. WS11]
MSRAHPHGFPDDTPEPLAQPYSAASAFIDRVLYWSVFAGVLVLGASIGGLVVWLSRVPVNS